MKNLEALRRETGDAMRRTEAERQGGGALPRVGDLYVLPQTAENPVEWAVLEHDPESNRYLVVPADTLPLLGSGDVEVPASEPGGPLALRCRHAVWLPAVTLWNGTRTGGLSEGVAARALEMARLARAGKLRASEQEEEVEEDVEYRGWQSGVLTPACASLTRDRADGPLAASRPAFFPKAAFQVAASVLMVVAVGLGAGLLRQQRQIASLRADLEASHRILIDPPEVTLFEPGGPVRGVQQVEMGEALALKVYLPLNGTPDSYRLLIYQEPKGETLHEIPIPVTSETRVSVVLPSSIISPGLYRMELWAVEGDEKSRISSDLVKIRQHQV